MRTVLSSLSRRLIVVLATVFIASFVIFASVALAPGDPAAAMVGGTTPNPDALAAIRFQFRLDDPLLARYWHWLTSTAHGDLGTSFVYRSDIWGLLAPRLETTLLLVAYSALLIIVIGVGSGVVASLSSRAVDKTINVVTSVLMGVPTFVVVIVLIFIFSRVLPWFPVYGTGEGLVDKLWHLTLPAVAMAVAYLAFVSRITRASMRSQMFSEHVETARSRGIPQRLIVFRHVLRNASSEILSVSGITVAGLFAGTAVAERAFGINGIGSLLVDAANRRDLPVVQIICLFMVVAFVAVNMIVDVTNVAIDPRIARGSRS
ncbi:ABC transporter permease [Rhodococcus sp. IEGM1428]|uniref:ABC transporter permease n=1 Tax=Rhodococcus sp. IEGM1428 TaxID=3392191 RepID=UPI003D0E9B96